MNQMIDELMLQLENISHSHIDILSFDVCFPQHLIKSGISEV